MNEPAMIIPEQAVDAAAKALCCPDCDCIPEASYCAITHERERVTRMLTAALPLVGVERAAPPLRAREEIAWAICPSIREYSCGEGIDPACSHCPNTVVCSEGEGIQACRHAANVAADRVLALSSTAGQEWDGGQHELLGFLAIHADRYQRDYGLNGLHPIHYDLMEKYGAPMERFPRATNVPIVAEEREKS